MLGLKRYRQILLICRRTLVQDIRANVTGWEGLDYILCGLMAGTRTRVTRLGEFSNVGRLLPLDRFFIYFTQAAHIFAYFFTVKVMHQF
jgi:hypothetical protein